MMKQTRIIITSLFVLFVAWLLAAHVFDNDVLMPGPGRVFTAFIGLFSSADGRSAIARTFFRLCLSLSGAYVAAAITAAVSVRYETVAWFLHPVVIILRTIPVISIIVIMLIVLGFSLAPYAISFLIVYPLAYEGIKHALESIDDDLRDVYALEDGRYFRGLFIIFFPLIAPKMRSVLLQSAGLAVKVLVMAEYLAQTDVSVGNRLYLARINLAYDHVFAWTICLVLITALLETAVRHARVSESKSRD